ncbi:alpha/beta hydrolase [Solimonas variicoloris]|uniref:alpha/beta hydrolase n=1 Tax=Solimonas variicoloris TaxID=254408 RepID=UPI000366C052|nr:alpha/beta hydrolase [Solimonas variicoloris]
MNPIARTARIAAVAAALGAASTSFAAAVEPGTQAFLDAVAAQGGKPIYTLSPAEARQVLSGAQAGAVATLPAEIEDRVLKTGPTGQVRVRIVRPAGNKTELLPVIVYFHGGGWVLGGTDTHDRLIRELANGAQAAVVFVDYDRSPEAQYPVPLEQGYAALKYVAEHAAELKVDASRLAVAGDSVGGNMAAANTLLAKQRGGPQIDFQLLFYPVTDADFDNGSYREFANGPWLTRPAMAWFWDAYLPDVAKRREPTASPLRASLEQLKGLPPALVITDENDVLRDEGEAYAAKLARAGVPVTQVRYLGTIHDFVMLNGLAATPATRAAIKQANAALRRALAR